MRLNISRDEEDHESSKHLPASRRSARDNESSPSSRRDGNLSEQTFMMVPHDDMLD
jgi:hypothetical protein